MTNPIDAAPTTPHQLHQFLRETLDIDLPRVPILDHSTAPFDYLAHAFFEPEDRPADVVVWASRGGGKTFLGAVATLLDLLFKPGVEVRILAGSLEQASRMHEHLRRLFEVPTLAPALDQRITSRLVSLGNGSRAHILAASETSIRGCRPQKLRCDEVELFDPDLWRAAQFVTRSRRCGDFLARGAIEALSTLHKPAGLMHDLVTSAQEDAASRPRVLFRWSTLDVLERCPPARACEPCTLLPECASNAKGGRGHVHIDDAAAMKRRASEEAWSTEMLCLRPSREHLVFPEFDPAVHVADFPWWSGAPSRSSGDAPHGDFLGAIDFGIRAPTVILWAHLAPDGVLRIVDMLSKADATLDRHADALLAGRGSTLADGRWPVPAWIGADPAGHGRSDQTGRSSIALLQSRGLVVRSRRAPVSMSIGLVRRRLRPAHSPGSPLLLIHPRCRDLIEALQKHHYPDDDPRSLEPVKDGTDHAIDALRYLVLNLDSPWNSRATNYTIGGKAR